MQHYLSKKSLAVKVSRHYILEKIPTVHLDIKHTTLSTMARPISDSSIQPKAMTLGPTGDLSTKGEEHSTQEEEVISADWTSKAEARLRRKYVSPNHEIHVVT